MKRIYIIWCLIALSGFVPTVAVADRLDDMISPVSNPVNFEDPRITSELRPIYLYHKLDKDFITQGGNVQIYALQARYALTDSLAIIANKDGYIDFNPDAVLGHEEGFGNVEAGFKYAFFKNESGQIATAGLTYEIPMGNTDVLQGKGSGVIRPFLSAGAAIDNMNFIMSTGLRVPFDNDDSTFYDLDLHADMKFGWFYPGIEFNLVHVLDGGRRLPIADEGADYFNFGSINASGESIVTGAAVARARLSDNLDWGVAYQFPMTTGEGSNVFAWRLTTDLIYRF